MTFTADTTTKSSLVVHHHVQDGEQGYLFRFGTAAIFLAEGPADELGRYVLFNKPE